MKPRTQHPTEAQWLFTATEVYAFTVHQSKNKVGTDHSDG